MTVKADNDAIFRADWSLQGAILKIGLGIRKTFGFDFNKPTSREDGLFLKNIVKRDPAFQHTFFRYGVDLGAW